MITRRTAAAFDVFHRAALYLAFDVPDGFAQVLNRVVFQVAAPKIFNGVTHAKIHMLNHIDAFDAGHG
jgi:hypothetical protein